MTLRGSCLCGNAAYQITGDPVLFYCCHCSVCRKASGSSFATNLIVKAADFSVTTVRRPLAAYESSPAKLRYFCPECGSPVFSQASKTGEWVSVRCGSLDQDPPGRPSVHLHVGAKSSWVDLCDGLPQHDEGLP